MPYSMSSGCAATTRARCQSSGMGFVGMIGSLPPPGSARCRFRRRILGLPLADSVGAAARTSQSTSSPPTIPPTRRPGTRRAARRRSRRRGVGQTARAPRVGRRPGSSAPARPTAPTPSPTGRGAGVAQRAGRAGWRTPCRAPPRPGEAQLPGGVHRTRRHAAALPRHRGQRGRRQRRVGHADADAQHREPGHEHPPRRVASTSAISRPPAPISSSPPPRTNRGGRVCRNRPPAPATTKLSTDSGMNTQPACSGRQPADRLQPQRDVDQRRRTRHR